MRGYQERLIEVIHYIESNLDSELNIDKLCQLTCVSKFHFHRLCTEYFGTSPISLVRLLRLKRAAYQLVYRNEDKIVTIALANGYESHEAFSRAFKSHFNMTPSKFRKLPDWTFWRLKYDPIVELRTKIMATDSAAFNVKVTYFPNLTLAVLEHRGSPHLLSQTILKFIEFRKVNKLFPSKSRTFNLVYNDPSVTLEVDYRFDIGCSVHPLFKHRNDEVTLKAIPEGKCAVIRHVGSNDSLYSAVHYLYSEWLINSCYELRDFPLFFERINFFPDVPENELITDIYLPIEQSSDKVDNNPS